MSTRVVPQVPLANLKRGRAPPPPPPRAVGARPVTLAPAAELVEQDEEEEEGEEEEPIAAKEEAETQNGHELVETKDEPSFKKQRQTEVVIPSMFRVLPEGQQTSDITSEDARVDLLHARRALLQILWNEMHQIMDYSFTHYGKILPADYRLRQLELTPNGFVDYHQFVVFVSLFQRLQRHLTLIAKFRRDYLFVSYEEMYDMNLYSEEANKSGFTDLASVLTGFLSPIYSSVMNATVTKNRKK